MNKTAIISGVSAGIGLATARLFTENGITVIGMGTRENVENAPENNFYYVRGNVAVPEDRKRLIDTALSVSGKIDILVNVAGVAPLVRADLLDMTEESYDRVMDINLKAMMFLTQAAAKEMIKNDGESKGAIVNISSISAYVSSVNRGEYCISKAGVSMLTKLFADRLAEYGITVNEVLPGIISTDMTSKVKDKYDNLIENGLLPIKRWGEPEDIARAVLTLCDGSLTYMTGQSLNIDGGFHIRRL